MQTMNLYKYDEDNGYCVTPEKRNSKDQPYCYRLIADENKILTNGTTEATCIDIAINDLESWQEIDNVEEENDESGAVGE